MTLPRPPKGPCWCVAKPDLFLFCYICFWLNSLPRGRNHACRQESCASAGKYERHVRSLARRGRRRAPVSSHAGSRQTRGHVRRQLPDHRRDALQLFELRPAACLHSYSVQGALSQPPHPRGLEFGRSARTGRVHRDPASDEARQRKLVSGHGRRCLPEHLLHRQRRAEVCADTLRRSHLQDELSADAGADVTLATILTEPSQCDRFGVVDIDSTGNITGFEEKPKKTKLRSPYNPKMVSGSMGVYLFNTEVLLPLLLKDAEDAGSSHDFGKDILPRILDEYKVYSYNFIDENQKEALYWRDVGTLEAYYEANMDLVAVSPVFNLYDKHWPIRTTQRQYPPAKFVFGAPGRTGMAVDSIVSSGCILSGGVVRNSVLSPDVRVNSYSEVDSSIVFSHVNIGRHCRIRHAILDRDVQIPEGTIIGYDPDDDAKNYVVTDTGITVVTRDYSLFESPVTADYFTSE